MPVADDSPYLAQEKLSLLSGEAKKKELAKLASSLKRRKGFVSRTPTGRGMFHLAMSSCRWLHSSRYLRLQGKQNEEHCSD